MAELVKVVVTLSEGIYTFETEKTLVQPGFIVKFINYTNEELVLLFPDEKLFGETKVALAEEEGVAELKVLSDAINSKKARSKTYPYILYSKSKFRFDKAAALPAIIVVSSIR